MSQAHNCFPSSTPILVYKLSPPHNLQITIPSIWRLSALKPHVCSICCCNLPGVQITTWVLLILSLSSFRSCKTNTWSVTAETHRSETAETHRSVTAETRRSVTAETHRSETAETHRSVTAETHRSVTAETQDFSYFKLKWEYK